MKKIRRLIVVLSGMSSALYAQIPDWEWAKGYCVGVGTNYWSNVATDGAGNTYYTAPFNANTLVIGNFTLVKNGQVDFFLAKYDSLGNVLWARAFGGTRGDFSRGISVDKACNIYICGTFQSAALALDNITLSSSDTLGSVFLAKFDSAGNALWARSGGGASADHAMAVACDNTRNVYVMGVNESSVFTLGSFSLNAGNAPGKIFTARYDSSGVIKWLRGGGCPNSCGTDEPYDLAADSTGAYITGSFKSNSLDWGDTMIFNSSWGAADIFFLKYDTVGSVVWAQVAGKASSHEIGRAIETDNYGHFYLSGGFSGSQLTLGTITLSNTSSGNAFLAKYDAGGNIIWARQSLGSSDEGIGAIAVNSNADVFLLGGHSGPASFGIVQVPHTSTATTYTNNPSGDVFVVKYDSAGVAGWARCVIGIDYQIPSGISVDNGNNVYVSGYYLGPDTTYLGPFYLQGNCNMQAFMSKLGVYGPTEIPAFVSRNSLWVYPNPAADRFVVNGNKELGEVSIYNAMGELVFEDATNMNELIIDVRDYPPGIYVLRSASGSMRVVKQ